MINKGFSLLEVLISILILSLIVLSVFYFYSGIIGNQQKLNERYKILRISREFIDNFREIKNYGKEEREGLLLEWEAFPIEEPRKMMRSAGGLDRFLQLKLVHLEILRKSNKKSLLSLNFVYNAFISAK
jgi:prepilin-type N-terminal cleavage/methylation domain-containing protein